MANEIVKCSCGEIMRENDWLKHWKSCKYASRVSITKPDLKNFELNNFQPFMKGN